MDECIRGLIDGIEKVALAVKHDVSIIKMYISIFSYPSKWAELRLAIIDKELKNLLNIALEIESLVDRRDGASEIQLTTIAAEASVLRMETQKLAETIGGDVSCLKREILFYGIQKSREQQ